MLHTHLGHEVVGSAAGARLVPKHTPALRRAWSAGQDFSVRGRKMKGVSRKLTSCCMQYTEPAVSRQLLDRKQPALTQRIPSLALTSTKNDGRKQR